MSLTGLLASPVLKAGLELVLPLVHDVLGGGRAADKVLAKVKLKALDIDGSRIAAAQKIIEADQEGNWLQRSWRPIAMFVFVGLLIYQVVLVSVVNAIFGADTIAPDAQLTYEIIQVIKWGMGGYIVGRSGEKITRTIIQGRRSNEVITEREDDMPPPRVSDNADMHEPPFMRPDR